ncbi:proteasome subunit alpha [Microtetraspora sp. NBRC 13810]|uniref:proteasome subunit alpha n=1 Tax=Microtetraspora sp. NBRC 13810 TaxID=3030990 RepID=UPI002555B85F|nr:proteasome subunit alpha [Microtetraspora sp. NBRC 13810]
MPFGYVPAEQQMRDKADYARKGIARGRSSVVLQYEHGILFVAHNASRALHKISEIYDRIGFAAVGRYNEFEALRLGGIRYADVNGYTYDRGDVTARGLANLYAQSLGMIFTESIKPYEVEIVVAEVGRSAEEDEIYKLTFDGSVTDEHGMVAIGGQAEAVAGRLKERYHDGMTLPEALQAGVAALTEPDGERPPTSQMEVAVLDRNRPHRKFLRLTGARLERLLGDTAPKAAEPEPPAAEEPKNSGPDAPTAPDGDIDTGSGD